MNTKLSISSRILVAFASGALIAVFFLPAWRIDLFAPQYPEGLTLYIWINKLSGDIDIINGLNHYIGMKHISEEMFPEFTFLPYVVGFFMLLGMVTAVTGNRKLLLYYVVLTIIGGLLVPYDLYRWGYEYGHNLDPKAAIQVPGLSYQPPVFGHKRVLNFDAYSFPDVAGWIVFGAGILSSLILTTEWYKARKAYRKASSIAIVSICSLFLLNSCTSQPQPFKIGRDECFTCKMGIADLRFGGEIITKKGKVYKFDDMKCVMGFINSGTVKEGEVSKILFMNFDKPNEFLDVNNAFFIISKDLRSPMNGNVSCYKSKEAAENMLKGKTGEIVTWSTLQQRIN